jgi:ABC-type uncharacterized transport system auxiliary subunit
MESHPYDAAARSKGSPVKHKSRLPYPTTLVFLGILVLAGCGHVRYPTNYVLNFPPATARIAPPPEAFGPLAIREFQCPEYLCEGRLVFRPTPEKIGFYEFHRWATSPRRTITQFVIDSVRTRPLFKTVALQDAGIEAAYVLSGTIEQLEEVDQGRDVQAVCTISAQLVDAQTKSVIWSRTASETVPVGNRDMAGIVNSLSAAVRMAVDRLVASMEGTMTAIRTQ